MVAGFFSSGASPLTVSILAVAWWLQLALVIPAALIVLGLTLAVDAGVALVKHRRGTRRTARTSKHSDTSWS